VSFAECILHIMQSHLPCQSTADLSIYLRNMHGSLGDVSSGRNMHRLLLLPATYPSNT
jgi:hypothetical protein